MHKACSHSTIYENAYTYKEMFKRCTFHEEGVYRRRPNAFYSGPKPM